MKRIQGRDGKRGHGVIECGGVASIPILHHSNTPLRYEICILAGGLSSRMGRDKARLRLGGKSFVSHIRNEMESLGLPIRVVRRDLIRRCGPLGGVYTGLVKARAETVIFLACDMPLISAKWVLKMAKVVSRKAPAVFTAHDDKVGFPFALQTSLLPTIEAQIAGKAFSLNALARSLNARVFLPPKTGRKQLFNVNTPDDLRIVRRLPQGKRKKSPRLDL